MKLKRKYVLVITVVISLILLVGLFITVKSVRQPKKLPTQAAEEQEIKKLKAEMEVKPMSTICAERGAKAITPFDSCPQGTNRLSENQQSPLFYCCR